MSHWTCLMEKSKWYEASEERIQILRGLTVEAMPKQYILVRAIYKEFFYFGLPDPYLKILLHYRGREMGASSERGYSALFF